MIDVPQVLFKVHPVKNKSFCFALQAAFNRSVSDWSATIGVPEGSNAFQFGEAGYYSFKNKPANVSTNDTKIRDYDAVVKALDFMNSKPPEPFLIFLPGIGSHPPYGCPNEEYQNMYVLLVLGT